MAALLLALLIPFSVRAQADEACANPANPVVAENCKPGTTDWQIKNFSPGISGYASQTSVQPGETIDFYVSTDAPRYSLAVFRSGYYGGSGGRLMTQATDLPGQAQPACPQNYTTGLITCTNWAVSYSLPVPADWISGIYVVKLTRADDGGESYFPFVVRQDARKTDILFQLSDTTYQAYNLWGGKSLYSSLSPDVCTTVTDAPRAAQVSFDRPYGLPPYLSNTYYFVDYPGVYWLESQGYNISYISALDTHRSGKPGATNLLLNSKAFFSFGHDEYWSQEMRDAITAARDAGVHLGFFASNVGYWRIQIAPDPATSHPDRVIVEYKTAESGPAAPSGPSTSTFRDPDGPNNPENGLIGVMYVGDNDVFGFPIRVTAEQAKDPIYRNTGLDQMPPDTYVNIGKRLVGWEWDAVVDNGHTPDGLKVLADSPVYGGKLLDSGRYYGLAETKSNITRYTAASGAIVFAAGTNQWSWGLSQVEPNPIIQQVTYNLLSDMGIQPGTPAASLKLDSPGQQYASHNVDQADAFYKDRIEGTLRATGLEIAPPLDAPRSDFLPTSGATGGLNITDIQATANGTSAVQVQFNTSADASTYVWVKVEPERYNFFIPVVEGVASEVYKTQHSVTISGLEGSKTYYYVIAARDQAGNITFSNEASFQTASAPLTTRLRSALSPLYRTGRCWVRANRTAAIGIGAVAAVVVLLIGWQVLRLVLRRRRPAAA
jgi:hypothetical protein